MKLNFSTTLSTLLVSLAFYASFATGGETLVDQKFESFNLSAPPTGWAVTFPTMLSIVPEDGHNVLKISNKGGKSPHVMVTLDPAKVAGKTLFFLCSAKLPGAFKLIDGKPLAVPKMLIEILGEEGKPPIYESVPIAQGRADWQKLEKLMAIPADATSVTAQVCVPQVDCDVFFDTFSIAVVSSSRPAAPTAPATPVAPVAATPAKLPNPPLTPDTSPTVTPPAAVATPQNRPHPHLRRQHQQHPLRPQQHRLRRHLQWCPRLRRWRLRSRLPSCPPRTWLRLDPTSRLLLDRSIRTARPENHLRKHSTTAA